MLDPQHLNKAVRGFGADTVLQWIASLSQRYSLPWVSVGSGNGALESRCSGDWLLVDPEPLSYASQGLSQPYRAPDYASVEQLLGARPQLRGRCLLLLNWPLPNASSYDREAIELLQPVAVLALTELFYGGHGAAGSRRLQEWRESGAYALVREARLVGDEVELDIRLSWWQAPSLAPPPDEPALCDEYESHIPLRDDPLVAEICSVQ